MTGIQSGSADNLFQMKCEAIKNNFNNLPDTKIILFKCGELSEDLFDSILYLVENQLERNGEPKTIIKKIFTIVVESLQNVQIHGWMGEGGKRVCFIIIGKEKEDYMIWIANLAENCIVEKIKSSFDKFKGLRTTAIKKIYLNLISKGKLTEKGGAGLGLMTIALKADNNINFDFEKINDQLTLFNLHIKVCAN